MISIEDLKRRRNEWFADDGSFVLLDADDCAIRVSPVYSRLGVVYVFSWMHIDNQFSITRVSTSAFDTAEAAKAWVERWFAEHFVWFDAA